METQTDSLKDFAFTLFHAGQNVELHFKTKLISIDVVSPDGHSLATKMRLPFLVLVAVEVALLTGNWSAIRLIATRLWTMLTSSGI